MVTEPIDRIYGLHYRLLLYTSILADTIFINLKPSNFIVFYIIYGLFQNTVANFGGLKSATALHLEAVVSRFTTFII